MEQSFLENNLKENINSLNAKFLKNNEPIRSFVENKYLKTRIISF